MKKNKKEDTQGEFIDEIRKARASIWRDYKGDMKRFHEDAKKYAEKNGFKYAVPPKKTKKELDDAA